MVCASMLVLLLLLLIVVLIELHWKGGEEEEDGEEVKAQEEVADVDDGVYEADSFEEEEEDVGKAVDSLLTKYNFADKPPPNVSSLPSFLIPHSFLQSTDFPSVS